MFEFMKPELKQTSKKMVQKKNQDNIEITPNVTGIFQNMKSKYENLSGYSFNDVRVHYNSDKPAQLQALAYTQRSHVYIASGQEKHLEHKFGHVVQQKEANLLSNKNIGDDKNKIQSMFVCNNTSTIQKYSMVYNHKLSENGKAIVTYRGGLHIHKDINHQAISKIISESGLEVFYANSFVNYQQVLVRQPKEDTEKDTIQKYIPDTIQFLNKLFVYKFLTSDDILKEFKTLDSSTPAFKLLSKVCFRTAFEDKKKVVINLNIQ